MTPLREDFTDYVITPAQMRATIAAASPQVPADLPPLGPAALAAQAWQDSMRRKRG